MTTTYGPRNVEYKSMRWKVVRMNNLLALNFNNGIERIKKQRQVVDAMKPIRLYGNWDCYTVSQPQVMWYKMRASFTQKGFYLTYELWKLYLRSCSMNTAFSRLSSFVEITPNCIPNYIYGISSILPSVMWGSITARLLLHDKFNIPEKHVAINFREHAVKCVPWQDIPRTALSSI